MPLPFLRAQVVDSVERQQELAQLVSTSLAPPGSGLGATPTGLQPNLGTGTLARNIAHSRHLIHKRNILKEPNEVKKPKIKMNDMLHGTPSCRQISSPKELQTHSRLRATPMLR
jgi:hypothetical protein